MPRAPRVKEDLDKEAILNAFGATLKESNRQYDQQDQQNQMFHDTIQDGIWSLTILALGIIAIFVSALW